ncbi:MAG: polysaccharide pyruvyl transferase family protein [Hyphomonadaceae bacterium]|nr:polysaccharide pyruvyl transferase family protein [Hyphomonadaceae bacterium]
MTIKPVKIGLLWHSARSGNLGVGALTLANIAIVRAVAEELELEPSFVIFGPRESTPPYLDEAVVPTYAISTKSMLSPWGCWKAIGGQDCVLDIAAGDSFADIYGIRRFAFQWVTKMIAIARGVPLVLSPQTIGPFERQPYVRLAQTVLNRASVVVARDPMSLEAVRKLAPKAHAALAVDVAFALPYEDNSSLRGQQRMRVGINVSALLLNEAECGSNRFGLSVDYGVLTRRLIADLLARGDVDVHLFTHCNHPNGGWDDDDAATDKIAAEFPAALRVPSFAGPSEAKSYISGLDFVVAGRMHACIAALSSGTPVVPIAYSRKFSGLFGMLDYKWMVPVAGTDTEAAVSFIHDCLERRDALAADSRRGLMRVEALLEVYRDELRRVLLNASGRSL